MNIPLLADKNMEISSKLMLFWSVNESNVFNLAKYGVLKDTHGILRQITINDLPVGRSVDETLRLVQAFQFTDKHGEGKFFNI